MFNTILVLLYMQELVRVFRCLALYMNDACDEQENRNTIKFSRHISTQPF